MTRTLLEHLLECSLAADERSGRGLIMAGKVLVDGRAVTSPQHKLTDAQNVRLKGRTDGSVSRGYHKLAPALVRAGIAADGRVCLDLGSSTGGFTQALLEAGATRVFCVDVGYGVMEGALRNDPRIGLLERTNVRSLTPRMFDEQPSLCVGDLSFISWRAALPSVPALLSESADLLLLVKPQFELAAAGRGSELHDGIAADPQAALEALLSLEAVWSEHGLLARMVFPAALRGAGGNQEYFVSLLKVVEAGAGALTRSYDEMCIDAVREAGE